MNKKGFTLIELLGVLILLSLLAVITIPAIGGVIKEGEKKADEQLKENIVLAAKNWALDNKQYLPETVNGTYKVSLSTLKSTGYVDQNIKMPSTGATLSSICVVITNKKETKKGFKYSYEYSESCS